jgi:hypothetical protein
MRTIAVPQPLSNGARLRTRPSGKALAPLLEAWDCAGELGHEVWQCAVEIAELRGQGAGLTELRRLLGHNLAMHALETTPLGVTRRTFRRLSGLALSPRACFVLIQAGVAVARRAHPGLTGRRAVPANGASVPEYAHVRVPRWDSQNRTLWWGPHVVKQFHRPTEAQGLILAAFQELYWPLRILDPLPPKRDLDPQERLHFTVKHLNEDHLYQVLHFRVDEGGQAVWWDLL